MAEYLKVSSIVVQESVERRRLMHEIFKM
jgi:hypothetical protein